MDRLTMRDTNGFVERVCQYGKDDCFLCNYRTKCNHDIFNRLAAYEDTGLTPEVCKNYKIFEDEAISKGVSFTRIVELMNAEAEGRMTVLPCKVGDTVWINGDKFPAEIEEIRITDDGIYFGYVEYDRGYEETEVWDDGEFVLSDIGKTVFLTREEAEAALKGENNGGRS